MDARSAREWMLTVFGTLTLEPRTIALTRLVIGECRAFPEVGAAVYRNAIQRTNQAPRRMGWVGSALRPRPHLRGRPRRGGQHAAGHDDPPARACRNQ